MLKASDEWQTPSWLFDELNEEFNFDIDLTANAGNSKCILYCDDYLKDNIQSVYNNMTNYPNLQQYIKDNLLRNNSCFMNPPYSNPKPFIEKAWEDSKYCKIVCLVKCDPSTRWWATFWDYDKVVYCKQDRSLFDQMHQKCTKCKGTCRHIYNGPKPGCEVRFFPKRIKFDAPEGLNGKNGPTFPCALVIMDRRGL